MQIILNTFLVLITSNKLAHLFVALLSGYVHYDIVSNFVYFHELLISVHSDF
jgi:hypothetical protein